MQQVPLLIGVTVRDQAFQIGQYFQTYIDLHEDDANRYESLVYFRTTLEMCVRRPLVEISLPHR